jgi:putative transposase
VRKSRYSEEQMVKILRKADRTPVGEVAKKYGISEQTIYNWRKHFGELESADVKRLRQLEQENARLKKLVAERDLEIEVMREIAAKKWWARRNAVNRSVTRSRVAGHNDGPARCCRCQDRRWDTCRS